MKHETNTNNGINNTQTVNRLVHKRVTLFFFYKNIFYKNIEAETCEILRIFKNKAKAEIWRSIDIILCVRTSVNTIQFYVFNFNSRIKQPLLVNKEFTVVITLSCP